MKKYFVVSDIHGCYDELIKALNEAGFDETNPSHYLIDCGDFFDRFDKALEVYQYYKHLQEIGKATILRGNHTYFLEEFLSGPVSSFNFRYNGLNTTIDSFLGRTNSFFSYVFIDANLDEEKQKKMTGTKWNEIWYAYAEDARNEINETYPDLLPWLESLPDYYETKNHIMTHASIQTTLNWKEPENGWEWQHWDKGTFINDKIYNTDKEIVVGHFYTAKLREMYNLGDPKDNSILRSPDGQKVFIDGCTPFSGIVNVYTFEDEEISE